MNSTHHFVAETVCIVRIVYDLFKAILFTVQAIHAILGANPDRAGTVFINRLN